MDVATYINNYTGTLPRVQYPRKLARVSELARETCNDNFDSRGFKYKILKDGALQGRYGFIVSHEGKSEFFTRPTVSPAPVKEGVSSGVYGPSIYEKGGYSTFSMFDAKDGKMLNSFLESGLPVLGMVKVMIPDGQYHMIAYLLRKDPADDRIYLLDLFETYDTTAMFFKGSNEWVDSIGRQVFKQLSMFSWEPIYGVDIIRQVTRPGVPQGTNLQKEEEKHGRCVMWSLVFLQRLSQMPDLKTRTDFSDLYNELIAENKTEEGHNKIMGLVYGSGRKGKQTYRGKKTQRRNKRRTMRHLR